MGSETKAANIVVLETTAWGIEVRCSKCGEKLDRVDKEQTAYSRTGIYLKHVCQKTGPK